MSLRTPGFRNAPDKKQFQRKLVSWFKKHQRALPWRKTSDPYRIWVSEIMLQQTRVEQVVPYYKRFLRAFPTVKKLARAHLNDVLKMWEGLGYYRRATCMHEASKIIVENHRGKIPCRPDELMSLPGFGPYTCGAVMSIAFNKPYPAVDGNVLRVMSRILKIQRSIDGRTVRQLTDAVAKLIPTNDASNFTQALMELGATICKPSNPECLKCPLKGMCSAHQTMRDPSTLPKKAPKKKRKTVPIAVGVIIKNGKVLIAQRPPDVILGNLWEFPGGKQEDGESLELTCVREIKEEIGMDVKVMSPIMSFKHHYSHYSIMLHFFYCRAIRGRVKANAGNTMRWVDLSSLRKYAFPRANLRVIERIFHDYHVH